MSSIRRSIAFSLADSYFGVALQLISSILIARLLTPSEIGVFSVAAVFSALAATFRDFGVAEYLIQEKNLTSEKIRAAFSANLIVSWLMAVLMYGSSSSVASFYNEPGVGEVMRVQSINFLLIPFGAVTMAYFRRELNYRPIFISGIIANLTSFSVAVATALAGFSYMSMAWSSLAGIIVTVGVSIWYRPVDFPRFPGLRGMRDVVHFGKHASGLYLFGQVGRSAPEAVIGKVLDMSAVAFFSRANGLMEIFNRTVLRAVVPVCLPYFARSARSGESTREGYLKAVVLLTGIGWPFFLCIGVIAYSVILLLYGPQWERAVPLAQILCLVAVIELPYYLATEVLIAEGRIDQSNRLQFLIQGTRLISLWPVLFYGLPGACWGLVAGSFFGALIAHHFLHKLIGLKLIDIIKASTPSFFVTFASTTPALFIFTIFSQESKGALNSIIIAGIISLTFWTLSIKYFKHPLWSEITRLASKLNYINKK